MHQQQPKRYVSVISRVIVNYDAAHVCVRAHHVIILNVCVAVGQKMLSNPASIRKLLEFMLRVLPASGENYLPVFRLIHGFCVGEGCLSTADEAMLLDQARLSVAPEDGGDARGEVEEGETKGDKEKCEGVLIVPHYCLGL